MGHTDDIQGLMRKVTPFDAEVAKYIMIEMAEESDVQVLFDTICTDAIKEGLIR